MFQKAHLLNGLVCLEFGGVGESPFLIVLPNTYHARVIYTI